MNTILLRKNTMKGDNMAKQIRNLVRSALKPIVKEYRYRMGIRNRPGRPRIHKRTFLDL
jgi:hypothetical protein